jgi:hypothetical protein
MSGDAMILVVVVVVVADDPYFYLKKTYDIQLVSQQLSTRATHFLFGDVEKDVLRIWLWTVSLIFLQLDAVSQSEARLDFQTRFILC